MIAEIKVKKKLRERDTKLVKLYLVYIYIAFAKIRTDMFFYICSVINENILYDISIDSC